MSAPWVGHAGWCVLAPDAGNGLSFLRLWHDWRLDPDRPHSLHVLGTSPEPAPVSQWVPTIEPALQPLATQLAAQWWGLTPGLHRLRFEGGRVCLTLWVGDTQDLLQETDWSAGAIAEGQRTIASRALVVGGGLAGASAASALALRGWHVQVLDAAPRPASGASGLPAGLMAPHLSGDDNLLSRLSRHGVRTTWQHAKALLREGIDWRSTGVLEHRLRARRDLPASQGFAADWHHDAAPVARHAAQLPPAAHAVWHPHAAWIQPAALVRAWLDHPAITWRGGVPIARLERQPAGWRLLDTQGREVGQAPLVVIAAALGSGALTGDRLAIGPVRGQLSWGLQARTDNLPEFPINGNGHLLTHIPTDEGLAWVSGSSYARGDTATDERPEDHADNLARLQTLVPALAKRLAPAFAAGQVRAWTGVRCASADRRPVIGELEPGLWVTTAMGSRGLTFAALCAELLAARLHGEPLPLPRTLAAALDLARPRHVS